MWKAVLILFLGLEDVPDEHWGRLGADRGQAE